MADRNDKGHFVKGNSIAKKGGRPPKKVEAKYLDAMIGAVPLDRWRNVIAKALEDAEGDDARARNWARTWLGQYLLPSKGVLDGLFAELLVAKDDGGVVRIDLRTQRNRGDDEDGSED